MSDTNLKLGDLVADLCQTNMALWKEEDKARAGKDDHEIANAKRAVDKLNQKRNDLIEKVDDFVIRAAAGK